MILKKPMKTLWEKEKMPVTSILSISRNVFFPIKDKFYVLSNIKILPSHTKFTLNILKMCDSNSNQTNPIYTNLYFVTNVESIYGNLNQRPLNSTPLPSPNPPGLF